MRGKRRIHIDRPRPCVVRHGNAASDEAAHCIVDRIDEVTADVRAVDERDDHARGSRKVLADPHDDDTLRGEGPQAGRERRKTAPSEPSADPRR